MKKIIFGVGILVCVGILLNGCVTGKATYDPNCKCQLTTKTAQFDYKIIDDSGGGIFDKDLEVWVKNKETQPSRVVVEADCKTVEETKHVSSGAFWVQPDREHTFKIKVPVGWTEDWKCSNIAISSDTIYDCKAS